MELERLYLAMVVGREPDSELGVSKFACKEEAKMLPAIL